MVNINSTRVQIMGYMEQFIRYCNSYFNDLSKVVIFINLFVSFLNIDECFKCPSGDACSIFTALSDNNI